MITLIILIVAVLLLSGFFSGAEAALVSLSQAEVDALSQKKAFGARVLTSVHRSLNRSVIAIVILNNVVNIVGSILAGRITIELYGDALLGVITTGLTFGVILFSEIMPKTIGIHYAEKIGPLVAPLIRMLTLALLPLILALEWMTNMLKRGERKVGTEEQIRSLVTIGRKEGHIEGDEGQLIHRAFILNDKMAESVMTPLKDVVGIPEDATVQAAAKIVDHHAYSRYPVFGASVNEVKGIVMSQDILEEIVEDRADAPVTSIMREALVVEADTRCDELIVLFRDKHIHLSVVQEKGKTVGLVTLEDVLEQLVGSIEDETDIED